MSEIRVNARFGAQEIIFETGKLAKQADAAVMVSYGGTIVLVTVCVARDVKEGTNFLPLTVDYREKTYAAGRIPGGFYKREGRPTDNEILTARLIDRPVRPLFPDGFANEIQIMGNVLSSDGEHDPDILSVIGASAALTISQVPFLGPIGVIRVIRLNNEFIVNPTYKQRQESELDVVVVGNKNGIVMLEGNVNQVPESLVIEAIEFGFKQLQDVIKLQESFAQKCGKPKMSFTPITLGDDFVQTVKKMSLEKIKDICQIGNKEQREEASHILQKELETQLVNEESGITREDVIAAIEEVMKEEVRRLIIEKHIRVDGRSLDQVREINCEVGVLPRTHGSGLFTRGQTQSLSVATLGTRSDEQQIENLEGESYKSFMLHYSFPPFSVGEIKPVRGPGRREIGHGALAEKSLSIVMPAKTKFPYTIRVVSEILESSGSSSMATVCAATLALLDAGVPITDPVAGVALGLVKEGAKQVILTDINGLEDHCGDMDFKVAGTQKGITAIQMDLKIDCIDLAIMRQAFEASRKARLFILEKMKGTIAAPRAEISAYAPRIDCLHIKQDKIGELIGPGGKMIRKIIETTGATIDIEDDGTVMVASTDSEKSRRAIEMINEITQEVEIGKTYNAKVKKIINFGAICEIAGGKSGLVHISELSQKYVKSVDDVVKIGDEFKVKVVSIDEAGRINLSKKQAE